MNIMRRELGNLNENIEEKVKNRTEKLQTTMEELREMNDQIVIARDQLWGEMQLAKKVDLVETSGMWIGMMDDIQLDVGDTVLLYTDGITEAWEQTVEEDKRTVEVMFGDDKLTAVFEKHGDKSTDEIQNEIIREIETGYQTSDDITMFVMKRVE